MSDFQLFVSLTNPAVISVCETWLTDQLTDAFISPAGYTVFRKDRLSRGGGVAVFVRNDIHAELVLTDPVNSNLEVIGVDLTFHYQKIRVLTCYRPPYYSDVDVIYVDTLAAALSNLCLTAQQNIILGDFNLPKINWTHYLAPVEPCYDKFITFVNNMGLQQHVHTPTHVDNVLDLVLTDSIGLISDVNIECPIGNSDHNTVHFTINIECNNTTNNNVEYYYDYKNADYEGLNYYMSRINWDYEFSFVFTVEEYWNIFLTHFATAIELYVPLIKRSIERLKNRKMYPRYLRTMLNHKALLWKKWRLSSSPADKQAYKIYTIKCKSALALYLRDKEMNIISSGNIGKFYRYVNNKLGNARTVHPVKIRANDKLSSNPVEQANAFNNYFSSVFTVDNGIIPQVQSRTNNNNDIFCDTVDFTVDNVRKALLHLKPSTSSGPDGVPNILLKQLAYSICNALCYIFNSSSFKSHCLPTQWLQAFATPIFKKVSTSDPANYRPIYLTCTCCRVIIIIIIVY